MTTLLAVVITDTGRVAQHGLTIASMPAVDEINRLSNTVNEQCVGLSLSKSAETVRSIAASAGYESVRGVADAHWTNARTNCTCPAPRTWPTPGPWPIWPRSSTRWKNRSC